MKPPIPPDPDVLAAQTVPLMASLICAHRDHNLPTVVDALADLEPLQFQALTVALTALVPPTVPMPAPASVAALLDHALIHAPVTPERAARNRADLADAIGLLPPPDDHTAVCSRCEQRKHRTHFHRDASTPTGISYRCKSCDTKLRAAARARQPRPRALAAAG